jgi:protein SCO1/2
MKKSLSLCLVGVVLATTLLLAFRHSMASSDFNGKDVSFERLGGTLDLTDQHGQRRRLADFKGKAVLIFFGYTRCPDLCPTTLARMAQTMSLLGDTSARVQVLWVTVDPERDTQELLANYMPAFHPDFLGLRGTEKQTEAVADAFNVRYQITYYKDETLVEHSAFGYLIDPRGRTRVKIGYDMTAAQIARDVRAILDGA